MSAYAVLRADDRPVDPLALREALVRGGGLTRVDANLTVRKARGIVAERLSREQAEQLHRALADAGIPALLVPQERAPRLGRPRIVRVVQIDGDALRAPHAGAGAGLVLPWPQILLVTAARIRDVQELLTESFDVEISAEGLPQATTSLQVERQETEDLCCDVVGLTASGVSWLRLLGEEFGVPAASAWRLPPGPRTERFQALLGELATRASVAAVPPLTHHLAACAPSELLLLKPLHAYDFVQDTRWRVALLAAEGAAGVS